MEIRRSELESQIRVRHEEGEDEEEDVDLTGVPECLETVHAYESLVRACVGSGSGVSL